MANPLNPTLYRQLQRVFGRVRIGSEGQSMQARYGKHIATDRNELVVEAPGEYYQVCCPRCNDTRFRLYINHRWGSRDEKGFRNLWLAICFNENCYASRDARQDLYEKLSDIADPLEQATIKDGEEGAELKAMTLPGPVFRLDRLPPEHPANKYLAGRFYDPEMLGKFYQVS